MMTSALVHPPSGNHFLTVCHYITTLGIIFNNNDLLSSAMVNETVPVLNALFEYLNKSDNKTAAKIHIFQEIRRKSKLSTFEELTNFADANNFYHYIINAALFAPYGNIADYVRNIVRGNSDKSFLDLHKLLLHDFTNNFIIINVCSLRKKSENINFLAIERIFAEYLSPVLTAMWEVEENLKNLQMKDLKVQKRFKRQSPTEENDNDPVAMDEDNSSEAEESMNLFRLQCLLKLKAHGLPILDQEKERFCQIIKSLALEQVNNGLSHPRDLYYSELITISKLDNFLANLERSRFSFDNFKLLTNNTLSTVLLNIWEKYPQSDKVAIVYHITLSGSHYGFVDFGQYNLHVVYPNVIFTVKAIRNEESEGNKTCIIDLEVHSLLMQTWIAMIYGTECKQLVNKRNSERMYAINKAADFISSFIPTSTFTEVANTLKSYILPVHPITSGIPTYHAVSQQITNYTMFLEKYYVMKITNNEYLNDVLYDSKFYFPHNFKQCEKQLKQIFRYNSYFTLLEYYNLYRTDLDSLQKKLRFEDYFRIAHNLKKTSITRLGKQTVVSLLRVALRQCDEELNDEPIVLYRTFYLQYSRFNNNTYTAKHVFLGPTKAFSKNRNLIRKKYLHLYSTSGAGMIIYYKVHFENRCGIADVYEFNRDAIKSHILAVGVKCKQVKKIENTIGNKKLIHVTLKSEEVYIKETLMMNMVDRLNSFDISDSNYYIDKN